MSAISRRAAGLAAVLLCAGVLAGCAAPASESAARPHAGTGILGSIHHAGRQPP